jgi:hypothetical protein|eukprot:COSAG01_NODE_5931_length_3946_cov_2.829218_4_plen_47_part_00
MRSSNSHGIAERWIHNTGALIHIWHKTNGVSAHAIATRHIIRSVIV